MKYPLFLVLSALLFTVEAGAMDVNCMFVENSDPKDDVVTYSHSVSVGDDVPVGSVIFRSHYQSDLLKVRCYPEDPNATFHTNLPVRLEQTSTPTPVVPGITSLPHGAPVYKTNVPGVGVSVQSIWSTLPSMEDEAWVMNAPLGTNNYTPTRFFLVIRLIKTGPVSPGAVDASQFPSAKLTYIQPSFPGFTFRPFPMRGPSVRFVGSVQIINSTCRVEAPDMTIPLGSHEVSDLKKDGVTAWKKGVIRLVGCNFNPGAVRDNVVSGINTSVTVVGTGTFKQGERDPHYLTFTLTPTTALISPTEGIISLTPSANNATGVGIQVANNDMWGDLKIYNFNSGADELYPAMTDRSMEIDVFARYIKTSETITPGKANGAVVYTINYN